MTQEMSRTELDDAVFSAMQEALSNAPLGISARQKVNMASELTAEALRIIDTMNKHSLPPLKKARKARKPRTSSPAPTTPPDAATPSPFGGAR